MDFFGDYSIETASCHPSSIRHSQKHSYTALEASPPLEPLSPRDTRTSYPIDLANVTNLSRMFSLQNLEPTNDETSYDIDFTSNYLLSSAIDFDVPSSPSARSHPSISSTRSPPCWKRRIQRQRDMRLHCDPTHLRSISELVERMVEEGDQCEPMARRRPSVIALPHSTASMDDDDDDISSDPSTPRSLSGSSSNGRRPSYFAADLGSPGFRRSTESSGICSTKDARVSKVRHRRSCVRERR